MRRRTAKVTTCPAAEAEPRGQSRGEVVCFLGSIHSKAASEDVEDAREVLRRDTEVVHVSQGQVGLTEALFEFGRVARFLFWS